MNIKREFSNKIISIIRAILIVTALSSFNFSGCSMSPGSASLSKKSVSYDGNGNDTGTAPTDSKTYAEGASVPIADARTLKKNHHHLVGWTTQSDGSGTVYTQDIPYIMGAEDVTFYAKWKLDFKIIYDKNGGTGTAPTDSKTYTEGTSVPIAEAGALQKDHYSLVGWTDQPDGGGTVYTQDNPYTMGGKDVTLYAKWRVGSRVFYDKNGATGTAPKDSMTYIEGTSVPMADVGTMQKDRYHLAGWTDHPDGKGTVYTQDIPYVMDAEDVTFYAKWDLNLYTVRYDGNGNDSGIAPTDPKTYAEGASVPMADEGTLKKDNHHLVGWTTQADSSETVVYTQDISYTMGGEDVTFYAKWGLNLLTVRYDGNGNDSGTFPPEDSKTYAEGTSIPIANVGSLKKNRHFFAGWTTQSDGGGTIYEPNQLYTMGTENVTFYAQWERWFTVKYEKGIGYRQGPIPIDSRKYLYGATVKVKLYRGIVNQHFRSVRKWKDLSNNATYSQDATFTITRDVTLVAQYDQPIDYGND